MYELMNNTDGIYTQPPGSIIIPDGGITGTGINGNGTTVSTNTTTDMTGISTSFAPCDIDYRGINTRIIADVVNATNVNACNIAVINTKYKLVADVCDSNFTFSRSNRDGWCLAKVDDDTFDSSEYHKFLVGSPAGFLYTSKSFYYNTLLKIRSDSYVNIETRDNNGGLEPRLEIVLNFVGAKGNGGFGQQSSCMEFIDDGLKYAFGLDLAYIFNRLGFTSNLFVGDLITLSKEEKDRYNAAVDKFNAGNACTAEDMFPRFTRTRDLISKAKIKYDFSKYVTVKGQKKLTWSHQNSILTSVELHLDEPANAYVRMDASSVREGTVMRSGDLDFMGAVGIGIQGFKDCINFDVESDGGINGFPPPVPRTRFEDKYEVYMGKTTNVGDNTRGEFTIKFVFSDASLISIDERIWKRQ